MLDKIKEVFGSFTIFIKGINNSVDSAENTKKSGDDKLDTAFANAYYNGESTYSSSSNNSQASMQPQRPTNGGTSGKQQARPQPDTERQIEDR